MNKLISAVKFNFLISNFISLSYANSVQTKPQIKIDDTKAFIEATDIEQKELSDTVNIAWYIKDRFITLDTKNHWSNLLIKLDVTALNNSNLAIKYQENKICVSKDIKLKVKLAARMKLVNCTNRY